MTSDWRASCMAVSALLGEPLDDVLLCMGGVNDSNASVLLRDLRARSRVTRARAIARVVADVVVALEELRLT